MDLNAVAVIGLVTMLGFALATDIGMRKIPNVVTLGGLGFALLVRAMPGAPHLIEGLLGAGLALVLFVPFFALGGIGGGDVKLLIATGAFLGLGQDGGLGGDGRFPEALVAMALIGAVLAIIAAARRRALLKTLLGMRDILVGLFQRVIGSPSPREMPSLEKPGGIRNPYGVSIVAGALIGLLWPWLSP